MEFARKRHKGQLDDNGEDYYKAHILPVFRTLDALTDDEALLAAALLHDTLEDTETSYEELVKVFGQEVADIVNEVTHEGAKDDYGFYFPRLYSQKGIMLKFADRLSNISRMQSWDEKRKQQYLKRSKFWKDGTDIPGIIKPFPSIHFY